MFFDIQKGLAIKTPFGKNIVNNFPRDITIRFYFVFGNTFLCIGRTLPNYKIFFISIDLWL